MIHVGDAAKMLKFLVGRDLTTAESFGFHYVKPDGTTGTIDDGATLNASGRSFTWAIDENGFFDQPGVWKFQAFAVFNGLNALGVVTGLKIHASLN